MSDSSAPAMSAGRRRTTAAPALIAVGAVIVWGATTGPNRLRGGAEALSAASPEPSGAAGTGMAELNAAIAATQRALGDATYWSNHRLPVSDGDPGWWHVVDHRIDDVEPYPEALLDNAAAHTAWRPSATDGATRYEAVDISAEEWGGCAYGGECDQNG